MAPEGCEETVFPVDDADELMVVDGVEIVEFIPCFVKIALR